MSEANGSSSSPVSSGPSDSGDFGASGAPETGSVENFSGGDSQEGGYDIDDGRLMEEAIRIANGSGPKEPPPSPYESKSDPTQPPGGETSPAQEESSSPAAPKADEWAKFYSAQKQFEAQKAEFDKMQAPLKEFQAAKESGDIAQQLKLLGYEDGVAFLEMVAANGAKMTPEARERMQLKKEIDALKQERALEKQQAEQTQAQARRQEAQKKVVSDIRGFLYKEASNSLAAVTGGEQEIYKKMQQHYRETKEKTGRGVELTPKQAAEMVEKDWEQGIKVFMKNPKFRNLVSSLLTEGQQQPQRRSQQRTPGRVVDVPKPTGDKRDVSEIYRGDKELEEALRLMNSRERARRPE